MKDVLAETMIAALKVLFPAKILSAAPAGRPP